MITGGPGLPPTPRRRWPVQAKIALGALVVMLVIASLAWFVLLHYPSGTQVQEIVGLLAILAVLCLIFGALGQSRKGKD